MNDSFINYNQMANDLYFDWKDDQLSKPDFTPWLDSANELSDFGEWLETDEAKDAILDKMLAYYKDIEDAQVAANKLYNYMNKGINNYFEGESKNVL